MKNQVFFFGAGASISEGGLPTSKLLFESLKNPRVDHRLVSSIIRFLKDLFSIENINGLKSAKCLPSFEELLTIVDVAILKQEEFSDYWVTENLWEIRKALVYCVAAILRIMIEGKTDDLVVKYHRKFIENIFRVDANINNEAISFISLNYDILLDSAIFDLHEGKRWDVDYGIKFSSTFMLDNCSQF